MRAGVILVLLFGFLPTGKALQAQVADDVSFFGDLRTGYFHLNRTHRDGSAMANGDLRARIRLGLGFRFSERLDSRVRLAGRYSTDQESIQFYLHDFAPAADGLRFGQATVDEAYLDVRPGAGVSLRVGRMQTKFTLADLQDKSLDRADSPNTDITWTDGAHLRYSAPGGWASHIILQHNSRRGATNTLRAPLDFEERDSRITIFAGVENRKQWGPVAQRGLDFTYIPGTLPAAVVDGESARDYIALVGRGSLAWPLGQSSTRLSIGGELGYAPTTPLLAAVVHGEGASGAAGGTALQVATSLLDFLAGHRLGLVYGRTEAGWLISPDFRNNDELLELRYQWVIASGHSIEARVRRREELRIPSAAPGAREDIDFFFRYSLRF